MTEELYSGDEVVETIETAEDFDLIDGLIDALNEGVSGVTFCRDVLETNRPDDWGALELTGDDNVDWADGNVVDQEVCADLWVCVSDRGSRTKRTVQRVLREFAGEHGIGWRFIRRNFLYDLEKVMWQWKIWMLCPLEADEEPEAEESGTV